MARPGRTPAAFVAALLVTAAAATLPASAFGQQLGEGMDRSGTVGIQSEAERLVFGSLICTCGCPREALVTCTCGFAAQRRDEVRAMMQQGLSLEAIQAEYVKRWGTSALTVPPNEGSNRLLWMLPLLSIAAMAGFVGLTLRRFRRNDEARKGTPAKGPKAGPADEYDAKLDDELRRLDDDGGDEG